ncbi:MAG: hypothetical protein ABIP19_10720 [Dermatophilaceae bacterium]
MRPTQSPPTSSVGAFRAQPQNLPDPCRQPGRELVHRCRRRQPVGQSGLKILVLEQVVGKHTGSKSVQGRGRHGRHTFAAGTHQGYLVVRPR